MSHEGWNLHTEMTYLDHLGTGRWPAPWRRRQPKTRVQLLQNYIDTVLRRDLALAPWIYDARDYAISLLKDELKAEKAHG